jgi:hypothetical protein
MSSPRVFGATTRTVPGGGGAAAGGLATTTTTTGWVEGAGQIAIVALTVKHVTAMETKETTSQKRPESHTQPCAYRRNVKAADSTQHVQITMMMDRMKPLMYCSKQHVLLQAAWVRVSRPESQRARQW